MAVRNLAPIACVMAMELALSACDRAGEARSDAGMDADTDADTDSDADSDMDGGTDTDTGPGDHAVSVSAGFNHTCAIIDGDYVKCWGNPYYGALGYGHDLDALEDADTSLPSTLPFVDVGDSVLQIVSGPHKTIAILFDGGLKCWGYCQLSGLDFGILEGNDGIIGVDDTPADHVPVYIDDRAVVQLGVTGDSICAVLDTGAMRCFGDDDGIVIDDSVTQVCTGFDHSCAVRDDGAVYCWGLGNYGALGYGDTDYSWDPLAKGPVDIGDSVVQVACGGYHTCALLNTGAVVCWGLGENGQLGYGNTDNVGVTNVPADVGPVDVGATVTQISAGERFTCAVLADGDVKCWGGIAYGLGFTVGDDETPASVGPVDLGDAVEHVDCGAYHACALMQTGSIRCWGNGDSGELGYGPDIMYIGDDETPAEAGDVPLL